MVIEVGIQGLNIFNFFSFISFIFFLLLILYLLFFVYLEYYYTTINHVYYYLIKNYIFCLGFFICCFQFLLFFSLFKFEGSVCLFENGLIFNFNYKSFFCQFIFFFLLFFYILFCNFLYVRLTGNFLKLFTLLFIFVFSLFLCSDIFGFMLSFEGISFILYIFASMKGIGFSKVLVKRAGLLYLLVGLFSSAVLLFGLSLLYGITGCYKFEDIELFLRFLVLEKEDYDYYLILCASCFVLFGLFLKVGVFPFHVWLVDVYSGLEDHIIFFFSIFTNFLIYFLIVLKFHFFFFLDSVLFLFYIFGLLSIVFGTFGAIFQTTVKRLIAFSSINCAGYVFFIFSLDWENYICFFIGFGYVINYIFMIFLFFICFFQINGLRKSEIIVVNLKTLKGLFKYDPFISINLGLILFSLMGLPPLFGFFFKFGIFIELWFLGYFFSFFFLFLFSTLGYFFYLNVVKDIFFYKTEDFGRIFGVDNEEFYIFSNPFINFLCFFINIALILSYFFFDIFLNYISLVFYFLF